jgi:NAD(P)-dependent dehydrogenase (short-subunit alcohol dehydrogenase family)/acyl carrier protein
LRSLGANVSCFWAKLANENNALDRRRIDPRQAEEIATWITHELSATDPLTNIVYCWGLAYRESAHLTTNDLELAQIQGCGGALHLVQALLQIGPRHMPKLWLMTRCTQHIANSVREVQIAQAPLWGLGRTIAMECPELRCARIDLDAPNNGHQSRLLLNELVSDTNEEEIVFRGDLRYVGRLAQQKPSYDRNAKLPISADATYLITGGLGGLGLLAAHALATHGAQHVVLMSRQGVATAEQAADIAEIEKLGATISIVRGDVTQADDVARILGDIEARMPPLRGILHTAGVLEDGALLNQSIERFRRVFGPKMLGTWNLHQHTQKKKLDFFLLYSSLSALLGPPGLSNYVAANTFLDALAHYRRNMNLPATSINWGLIADKGMASKAQSAGRVEEQGVIGMSASTYESLLVRALRAQWEQMGLAEVNFRAWRERFPQVASLHRFDRLLESLDAMVVPAKPKNTQLLEAFTLATAAERNALLERFVREQLAAILRLDPKRIELRAPLRTLGIDSLMSLELRNRLESALGLELSATLVWSHPHVTALADHLSSLLSAKETSAEPQTPDPVPDTLAPAPPQNEAPTQDGDHLLLAFDQSMKRIRNRRRP